MTNKLKVGDSVRRKSPRAKAAKIVGEYGKGWYDISYPSTDKRYRIHQRSIELIVKPEPKQDRSELYNLLPRVSEWRNIALYIAVELTGKTFDYISRPTIQHLSNQWYDGGTHDYKCITLLPPSINWKDTLVSREEMEEWEKSQIPAQPEPTEDELNMPICKYYQKLFEEGFTETPQTKVERLKSELKEAEQELEKVTPVQFKDASISSEVFIGMTFAPPGLSYKCLMFNSDHHRMEQSTHNQYTVLTFFKK